MTNLKPDTWHLPSFITTILLLYFNVFIVNTTIFVSSHQQTADNTWTCLSREQLIALSNSKNTYRFEAQIIQLDKGITDHDVNSNAFVKITKILRQPIGKFKQITLHELVHVNEIKSRDLPVDARVTQYDECLPKLERGKVYEWITYSLEDNDESNDGIQKQFTLLPGGVFSSILSPPGLSSSATVSMKFNQNNGSHSEVCSKRECRFSAICEEWLSKDTNQYIGVCVCPTLMDMARNHMCNINSGTICTTNGIFYLNECVMLHQACLKQTELKPINLNIFSRILSQSDCTQLIERTSSASSNQLSILNASTLRPNYQNDYGINLQPSHSNNLQPKTDEIPQHDSPLHIQQSSNIAVLEYNTGEANPYRCSMKTCPTELNPVCDSDGTIYANDCLLKKYTCQKFGNTKLSGVFTCGSKHQRTSNPCLHHTCRWQGEKCQVDINGQAKCICPEPCPPVISPVCGSDGVTYDSTCHLERTACQKMREIHVLYSGECSQAKDCLLLNQPCQGYEICSRIKNPMVYGSVNRGLDTAAYGLTNSFEDTIPQCICPTCPENGLGGQVCGSDGQTYRSECHLRSSACQRHSLDLTVKSRGKCDACQTKQCKYYAICQLSAFGEPQCICPTDCLYVRKPVCGTDGKTYENECFLKVKSCADQREVHVAQEGYCRPCAAGCPLGFQCRNGQCVCRDTCPPKHPTELDVCGTDGKLYPSECELKRQSCIQQANIDVDLTGVRCRGRTPTGMQDSNMKMSAVLQADGVRIPTCTCNKLGALSEECDYLGNCRCKWGVGGLKCDQCLGNYWGIQNNHECIPCSCHPLGSVDASCNQATGQCNCRAGVVGRQCSMCPDGSQVTENDCNAKEKNENLLARLQEDGNQLTNGRNDPAKQKISKNTTITLNSQSSDIIINTTSNDNNDAEQNNGRLFTETTTLLVRIPFHMDQPTELQLTLRLLEANGMLLHYQSPPSEQEQLLLYNAQDHQFTMGISNWRVVLKYIDGRVPNRILLVHSKENLTRNVKHTIQTGIVSGRPWIQIDESTRTTNQDVIEKWANKPSDNDGNNDNNNVPTVGGLGTVVIGRHIKLGSLSASAMDERMEAHEDYGFSGCLSKVTINAGSPTKHFALDLLHSTKTNLAWLGIEPNPSTGLIEAQYVLSQSIHWPYQ
ncbi:unnamed protein product [Heterobilharzia americana]|nr:unnamed protein product [Heterobilharzia americana]